MKAQELQRQMVDMLAQDSGFIAERVAALGRDGLNLMHGIIGISTEAGEMLDALKKALTYGAPIDRANIAEELGDLLFYVQLCCKAIGASLEQVMTGNVMKLKLRYPEGKWIYERAVNRNTDLEADAVKEALSRERDEGSEADGEERPAIY